VYLRFVRAKLKPGMTGDFRRFYERRVVPALESTRGCLEVALLRDVARPNDVVSLTLWARDADARVYDRGMYFRLLNESDPYLADGSEWQAGLPPGALAPDPIVDDPVVQGYTVELATDPPGGARKDAHPFAHILSIKVEAGRFTELLHFFREEVTPALRTAPGFRNNLLVRSVTDPDRALAVSFWERPDDAARFEATGKPDELTARAEPMLSWFYRWQQGLRAPGAELEPSRHDLGVSTYTMLLNRRLAPDA